MNYIMKQRRWTALLLALAMACLVVNAGGLSIGAHVVYRSDISSPGLGLNYRYQFSWHFRANMSSNYYFKHDGAHRLDTNVDANIVFNVGRANVYPIVGLASRLWFSKDKYTVATVEYEEKNTEWELGANLGCGVEYSIDYHWWLTTEVKYQPVSHAGAMFFSLGAAYRF